jgi:nitrate reductase gamma subunit
MSTLVHVIAYASVVVFLVAVIARIVSYVKKPQHVRWELYPVAHDPRAGYGGSYLEDVDWWQNKPKSSLVGELKVMVPEILFLKAVWEHNRPLWFLSYPFHLGLYVLMGFIGLQLLGAILLIGGVTVHPAAGGFGGLLGSVIKVIGPVGFVLGIVGALGLLIKRLTDPALKLYSSVGHYFNLVLFMVTLGLATATWWTVDPDFVGGRVFLASLLRFEFLEVPNTLFLVTMLMAFATVAYIPLTHMSHFFMKYFLYHDIRWGDEPNVNLPATDAKIATVLNYPVSWAAAHIEGDGKKTWAEVATFNPMRPDGKEPE